MSDHTAPRQARIGQAQPFARAAVQEIPTFFDLVRGNAAVYDAKHLAHDRWTGCYTQI